MLLGEKINEENNNSANCKLFFHVDQRPSINKFIVSGIFTSSVTGPSEPFNTRKLKKNGTGKLFLLFQHFNCLIQCVKYYLRQCVGGGF